MAVMHKLSSQLGPHPATTYDDDSHTNLPVAALLVGSGLTRRTSPPPDKCMQPFL
jgi:hypothetical protein